MPATNPFFYVQGRLKTLIQASPYFVAVRDDQILTEQAGDLNFLVPEKILKLGFGVVITTAHGNANENQYESLRTIEDLNISITHRPNAAPAYNALDALWAVVMAVHGQSIANPAPNVVTDFDLFKVVAHQRRTDVDPALHVHELHVQGGLRLL